MGVEPVLAESIIRIGRPIKNGSLSPRERIRLLTDVASENCKNYLPAIIGELHTKSPTVFCLEALLV